MKNTLILFVDLTNLSPHARLLLRVTARAAARRATNALPDVLLTSPLPAQLDLASYVALVRVAADVERRRAFMIETKRGVEWFLGLLEEAAGDVADACSAARAELALLRRKTGRRLSVAA